MLHKALHKDMPNDCEKAWLLIVRNGVDALIDERGDDLWDEQVALDVDKMAFMKGRVVNKRARWNLCFADYDQEPDYENKRGRIVDFKNIPLTQKLRKKFAKVIGDKGNDLMGEGNYYYNSSECGIGFHGDAERRKVVGVRLGASMPLEFQWYSLSVDSNELGREGSSC